MILMLRSRICRRSDEDEHDIAFCLYPTYELHVKNLKAIFQMILMLCLLHSTTQAVAATTDWQIFTHGVENQADVVGGSLVGKPGAGKRAFYIELVRELLRELKITAPIQEVPFARGVSNFTDAGNIVLFNVSRTPERESLYQWVGPIISEKDYFYELASKPTSINVLADAKNKSVCVVRKNINDDRLTAQGFTNLTRIPYFSTCFRLLTEQRVDLVASATLGINEKLKEANVQANLIKQTPALIGESSGYIALSKSIPKEEVERWNIALKGLKQKGIYEKLYKKFVP